MMVMAIVQARMDSQRFPGKMLAELVDRSVLQHVIERLHDAEEVTSIVVAVPSQDTVHFAAICSDLYTVCNAPMIAEEDVLARFVAVMNVNRVPDAQPIVRVCGDNPLLWPTGVDALIQAFAAEVDYVGYWNGAPLIRTPTGYFAEVVKAGALRKLDQNLPNDSLARQHVTETIYSLLGGYVCRWLQPPAWYTADTPNAAIDTPDDLCLVKAMLEEDRVPWRK